MTAIGFRAAPDELWWAVVRGDLARPELVADGHLTPLATLTEAEKLTWTRTEVMHLVKKYAVDTGVVRYQEPMARGRGDASRIRARVEGVILEALAASGKATITGPLATLASELGGHKASRAKAYIQGVEMRGISWGDRHDNAREAILAATAGLA